ncbi:MAG: tRNA pseudouridine(38-40) synthase TruA [Anaerolineales bacterium]|jgi:tRNA pseudouridine38-40 synthase
MSDRFQVRLAYDGTDFYGSQYQPDRRTVQGELQRALGKIGWQEGTVYFAGRTDAGVHAAGQVVAFDLKWDHTEKDLGRALNAVLPQDMAAGQVRRTGSEFQPRYDALSREYHYRILNSPIRDPLQERYCWRVWPRLDLRRMRKETRLLVGSHDFAALGSPHQPGGSTIRKIERAGWKRKGNLLVFEIVGNAFLYHMVRRIVMALVKAGQDSGPAAGIQTYLEDPASPPAKGLAPARGLTLVKVKY